MPARVLTLGDYELDGGRRNEDEPEDVKGLNSLSWLSKIFVSVFGDKQVVHGGSTTLQTLLCTVPVTHSLFLCSIVPPDLYSPLLPTFLTLLGV